MSLEHLTKLLKMRHSCRAFKPEPVDQSIIEDITRAAGRVPSWCNAQPWQVDITLGNQTTRFRKALMDAVSKGAEPDLSWPTSYPGVTGDRRRTCGYQLYEAVGIAREDRAGRAKQSMRNFELFDAPHVAIISSERELGAYGALDCGGFVTAFCLAAQAMGVATIPQASVAAYPDVIRAHFNLPDSRIILCAVSFGFADETHPANNFRTEKAILESYLRLHDDR